MLAQIIGAIVLWIGIGLGVAMILMNGTQMLSRRNRRTIWMD